MPERKATPPAGQISSARVVPLHIETAKRLGGGARGRTLALIYRQLCYWSKYAKWKGSGGKKFFYKSQRELAEELGYSEKTINRAIKALRELGLVVVEQLHKRYWRQVYFYYLPHSAFADAEPTPVAAAAPAPAELPRPAAGGSCSTTTNPSALKTPPAASGGGAAGGPAAELPRPAGVPHPAATATAASIRAKGGAGFGHFVRIQQKKNTPLIKNTLQSIVERCNSMGEYLKSKQQEQIASLSNC